MENNATRIKVLSTECGFDACGIASADFLPSDSDYLKQWISNGFNGDMAYMENHQTLRENPRNLMPEAKSVVVVLLNYYSTLRFQPDTPQIAKWRKCINSSHTIVPKKVNITATPAFFRR